MKDVSERLSNNGKVLGMTGRCGRGSQMANKMHFSSSILRKFKNLSIFTVKYYGRDDKIGGFYLYS